MSERGVRRIAVAFLLLQALGAVIWWLALFLAPAIRAAFLAPGAPASTLLAFCVPDLLLYVGAGVAAALGLARRRPWAWPLLCLHAGAAVYAALYALSLPLLSGGGWWGACLMAPSLVCLPYIVWSLRPGDSPC